MILVFAGVLFLQGEEFSRVGEKSGDKQAYLDRNTEGTETLGTEENTQETERVQTDSGYYGPLQVDGTKLTDADGNPVQLRGVSTHGLAWYPEYVNEQAVAYMHQKWGINVIRLALYTTGSGGYCVSEDGSRQYMEDLIDIGVKAAAANDMYVIIDWHILEDGNPNTYIGRAKDFFAKISEKYKDYENVLYEICNEPNSGCSWEDIKTYANEGIPVIRENAPEAVILVGTPTWSQEIEKPQNDPITGYDNIMYTLHFYAATHKEDLRSKMVNAVEAGTPVFVSEYGLCDASGNGGNDLGQAQSWIDTMDQHGISYAVWSFCNKEETSALIASSCRKTSGFTREDLSESGKWIMDMLHTVKTEDGSTQTVVDSKDKTQNQNNGSGVSERTEADETEGKTGTDVSEKRLNSGNLSVDAKLTGSWESEGRTFYQYQLTITNNGEADVSSWEISLQFSDTITLSDGWNGEYQADGSTLTIHSLDYNSEIEKGASTADVGFIVSAAGTLEIE